jgi:predicted lipoprotein
MKFKQTAKSLSLPAVVLMLTACGGGGGSNDSNGGNSSSSSEDVSFSAQSVVDNAADNIITQTYVDLNTAAAALLAAVEALEDGGATELEMDAAQAAWQAARVPWESSEGFLFGPVSDLSVDPAIDSWPLNTPDLTAFLNSNPTATKADVEAAGDDLRGFHAIEWLLFGDGVADNDKTAAELSGETGALNYLVALAEHFKDQTQALEDGWTTDFNGNGPYATLVKTPAGGNPVYASYTAVMTELVDGIITIANEIGNAKIADPLGPTIGDADTSQVESQFSWNSLTDFHNNTQSIMNVYTGRLGFDWQVDTLTDTDNGLYAFVLAHDSNLATRVFEEIRAAQQAIALIKGDSDNTTTEIGPGDQPFRNQIADAAGRVLIEDAVAALNTLLDTLTNDVKPLIGATDFQ